MKTCTRAGLVLVLSAAVIAIGACVGDDPASSGGSEQQDASPTSDALVPPADALANDACTGSMCSGACVDVKTSAEHCGACGHACGKGFTCAAGLCGNDVVDVAAGQTHACALTRDKRVVCWGNNAFGQTGTEPSNADDTCGITKCRATPTLVAGLDDIVQVSLGADFGCAVRNDGAVLCWGLNGAGQLARPLAIPYAAAPAAVALPVGKKAAKVSCGSTTACVRTLSNEVYCWGGNAYGEAGATPSAPLVAPVQVAFDAANVIDLQVSYDAGKRQHACALRSDKTVWCWGTNLNNELGHGGSFLGDVTCSVDTPSGYCNPVPKPAAVTGATAIAVGPGSSCASSPAGVECWGTNEYNEIGASLAANFASPAAVVGLPAPDAGTAAIVSIHQGASNEYALDGNAQLWVWGVNTLGQLGTGSLGGSACVGSGPFCVSPTKTQPSIARVAAGYSFALALQKNGAVLAWGSNDHAELGHLPNAMGAGDVPCSTSSTCNTTQKPISSLP